MNGSHLALGATALLAAVSAVSRRGSAKRYRAKGRIDLQPEYEFEFDASDFAVGRDNINLRKGLREEARAALMNADWNDFWKESVEHNWRWGTWWEGDWDDYMEIEEAPDPSIRDLSRGHRPPLLEG